MTSPASRKSQAGITLIEALVSLLILALGILGLAAVQTRMLVENRVTNSRATAVRLIADLGERMRINAAGANLTPNPYLQPAFAGPPAMPTFPCAAGTPCTPNAVATFDHDAWLSMVGTALPGGRATITPVAGTTQVQVIVAWLLNERAGTTFADQLRVAIAAGGGDACPANYICHIDYIEIPAVTQ